MEQDDLKTTWQNESNSALQKNLTTLIIDKMTQEKYQSKNKNNLSGNYWQHYLCNCCRIYCA